MADKHRNARAFWTVAPGRGEIRETALGDGGEDPVLVRALFGALSRGTEALVFQGKVPQSEYDAMRAPLQEGDFPAPVKYGYICVGAVEDGPDALIGRTVFCLHPHQTRYCAPAAMVQPVPDDVPAARAVLAANMETAINVLWDCRPVVGDTVTVLGAGVLGCLIARLAARIPGVSVELVDPDASKAPMAAGLGFDLKPPDQAAANRDMVVNVSANPAALRHALDLARDEGFVVEASWYGDREVSLPLGGAFHARRLRLISSQVGQIGRAKRGHVDHGARLRLALSLLQDDALDALFTHEVAFDDLPDAMARFAGDGTGVGCVRIVYP